MRARHTGGQGGQAMVEFALSLLVLVPLLVGALYVGELFSAAAKAQEAEISTTWEVSGHLLHDYQGGNSSSAYTPVLHAAANRVAARLSDLDSFEATGNTGRPLPFQQLSRPYVSCQVVAAPESDLVAYASIPKGKAGDAQDPYLINTTSAWRYLHPNASYVACLARVYSAQDLSGFNSELAPYDQGLGRLPGVGAVISFCGVGTSLHGCNAGGAGGMATLTDDWAVESGSSNAVGSRSNARYYNVGQAVYGGGMAHRVIEDGMRALMGQGDQGKLSSGDDEGSVAFRLGLYDRVSQYHVVPTEVGNSPGAEVNAHRHLTPYDSDNNLPRAAHLYRANGRYLGQPSPNYNQP